MGSKMKMCLDVKKFSFNLEKVEHMQKKIVLCWKLPQKDLLRNCEGTWSIYMVLKCKLSNYRCPLQNLALIKFALVRLSQALFMGIKQAFYSPIKICYTHSFDLFYPLLSASLVHVLYFFRPSIIFMC